MLPPSEHVHWWFATGVLMLGLVTIAQTIAGPEIWNRRAWRRYLWPGLIFAMGVLLWPVMVLYTNSTIHMVAHGSWAETLMLSGAAELGLARGKLRSPYWRLLTVLAFLVSGAAFLVHEQNPWLFQRSSFLHHVAGWTLVVGAIFPLIQTFRPRSLVAAAGFATTVITMAVILFADRDVAPIFGHLSQVAGTPHR
jgi:hypothetical protein